MSVQTSIMLTIIFSPNRLKQVEDAAERLADAMKEMSKPLARYADDEDLDKFLKAQEREGDPMLDYIKRKQGEAIALSGRKYNLKTYIYKQ